MALTTISLVQARGPHLFECDGLCASNCCRQIDYRPPLRGQHRHCQLLALVHSSSKSQDWTQRTSSWASSLHPQQPIHLACLLLRRTQALVHHSSRHQLRLAGFHSRWPEQQFCSRLRSWCILIGASLLFSWTIEANLRFPSFGSVCSKHFERDSSQLSTLFWLCPFPLLLHQSLTAHGSCPRSSPGIDRTGRRLLVLVGSHGPSFACWTHQAHTFACPTPSWLQMSLLPCSLLYSSIERICHISFVHRWPCLSISRSSRSHRDNVGI